MQTQKNKKMFDRARQLLLDALIPRYGEGEALAIARIVLEDAFNIKKRQNMAFSDEEWASLATIVARLQAGEPVQYVLGQADFFGLVFQVTPDVLIPRQETEELVALALDFLKGGPPHPTAMDIGAGSGCIGLALARNRPDLTLWGMDKSGAALAVAQENARRLGITTAHWLLDDALAPQTQGDWPVFDMVISNPPYIPWREKALMPEHVLAHEPTLALFVPDDDPLLFYEAISMLAWQHLRPGGGLFFECNEFNAPEVAGLLEKHGYSDVRLRQDLSGKDRMVSAFR